MTKPIVRSLGAARLADEIDRREMTHREVEELVGLVPGCGAVSKYCSGAAIPGAEILYRIEVGLSIPMRTWFEPEGRRTLDLPPRQIHRRARTGEISLDRWLREGPMRQDR